MYAAFELIDISTCLWMTALTVGGVLWASSRAPRRSRWKPAQFLLRGEQGAAYTLSYVMVVPIYAWLMCLIAESVMMMGAKLGTNYAAFAGARTASVWASATSWDKVQEKTREAAIQAFIPFASGTHPVGPLQVGKVPQIVAKRRYAAYLLAYKEFSSNSASATYLTKKYIQAHLALNVTMEGPPATWDSDIAVTVEYKYPFQVPGIGRLLGRRDVDGRFYFPLRTTVLLPNEGPQNTSQKMGIGYGTF